MLMAIDTQPMTGTTATRQTLGTPRTPDTWSTPGTPRTPDTRPAPERRKAAFARPRTGPRIVSVGTANPATKYTQDEVLDIFQETDPKIRRVFNGGHIETRHLFLEEPADGTAPSETNQELAAKH
ncbi:MAG: hypothetical protein ACYSWU_00560, partial [Planctomycetota bacterium]